MSLEDCYVFRLGLGSLVGVISVHASDQVGVKLAVVYMKAIAVGSCQAIRR